MRLIDADNLKQEYGMKDDCADCEKETKGKVKSCKYGRVYTLMDFCGWIDDMPTIEPERKKGKWILVTDNRGQHFECDHCGEWRYNQEQKFCGECGADMRGEGE